MQKQQIIKLNPPSPRALAQPGTRPDHVGQRPPPPHPKWCATAHWQTARPPQRQHVDPSLFEDRLTIKGKSIKLK